MASEYVHDMTSGNIPGQLLAFSAPMLVGNIVQQFYNMADSVIVGNYVGARALGAVGACNSLNFLFFSLCSGMALGIGVIMAQYFGAQSEVKVKKTIINGFFLLTVVSVLMGGMGYLLAEPALRLLRTPTEYIGDSVTYLRTVSCGMAAVAAYNGVAAMLRALGDSKTPLIFLVLASLLNIGLDLLFVLYFNMAVYGVAIATVIAQGTSAAGCMIFAFRVNPYFKVKRKDMILDRDILSQCIRLGVPVTFQNALIAVSTSCLQGVANGFGPSVATAYTMTTRLEQLIGQPYSSMASGVSTFTGQNMGAGRIKRVRQGLRTGLIFSACFSVVMLILMRFGGHLILRLFGNDTEILGIAVNALKITSFFYFPLGVIYLIRGLSNGAGDAAYSMMNGIVEVFCRFFFSMVLTRITGIGMWGVWLTTGFTWSLIALASVVRYKQKKWMRGYPLTIMFKQRKMYANSDKNDFT